MIMASHPITSWQIDRETMETVTDFIFLSSKISADGDCSNEIKRCLLLRRKGMTNLDSILKSRDITLPKKVRLVKWVKLLSRVWLFLTPSTRLLRPWDFPGKGTGVGCPFLLQGNLQQSNPGLPHCRQMLYHLSHQGDYTRQRVNKSHKLQNGTESIQ